MEGINWFSSCGENDRLGLLNFSEKLTDSIEEQAEKRKLNGPVLDYFWDYKEVWASFMERYRIDLYKENLHWWGFVALMGGFTADSPLSRLIVARYLGKKPTKEQVINKYIVGLPKKY